MALTKDEYKLLDRMNKRLRTWQKKGLTNEVINRVKNDLINFYEKNDREHPSHEFIVFSKSNKMSESEKNELLRIARSMEQSKSSSVSWYQSKKNKLNDDAIRNAYETIKGNPSYGVNNWQDYIDFIDNMENWRKEQAILRDLDSKLVARTYAYGKEKNLTTEEVNKIMEDNVLKYQNGGSEFEMFLRDEIDRLEEEHQKSWVAYETL